MCKSIVKGAIFGGIILFVWYMISWMALPWHKSTMNVFKNSSEVEAFMMKETPKSGIYVLPCHEGKKGDTAKKSSPSLFVSMNKEGVAYDTATPYIIGLITQIVAAAVVSWMLCFVKKLNYFSRVIYCAVFGLAAGIVGFIPGWNWMGFPFAYALIGIIDLIIGWFLAGLVIAKVTKCSKCTHISSDTNV